MAGGVVGDGQITVAFVQRLEDVVVVQGVDIKGNIRPLLAKAGDGGRRDAESERGQDRQPDVPIAAGPQVPCRLPKRFDPAVDVVDLAEQGVRLIGRHEAPFHQAEQSKADPALGVLEHLADRRLGDVEGAGSGADGAGLIDRVKHFDVAQVHRRTRNCDHDHFPSTPLKPRCAMTYASGEGEKTRLRNSRSINDAARGICSTRRN